MFSLPFSLVMELQHHHLVLVILVCFTTASFYKVISTDKGYYYRPTTSFATSTKISDVDVCRSLFTINGVPSKNVFRHVATSETPGAKSRAAVTYGEEEIAAAARGVRHLVHKRASSSGPDTADYRVLGALLPNLVSFEHLKGEDEAPAGTKQGQPRPHVRGGSRIDAGGGVLPFVPCVIAPYDQPASFATCVRRRLEEKGSFWIYFMGDSKIRHVFLHLLDRTDKIFRYRIECKNETMTYRELDRRIDELRWETMEAVAPLFPGLRVTNRFSMFEEHRPSKFSKSKELRQLQRWSEGAEDLPDLLIVGYTSWMLQQTRLYNNASRSIHDVLAMMLEMHRYVVPRLEKISKATRVIVLSQSRQRPHSSDKFNKRATFSNANLEWSEMTFLHLMRAYREGHAFVRRDGQQADAQDSEHETNRQGSFDWNHAEKTQQSTHTQDRDFSNEPQDRGAADDGELLPGNNHRHGQRLKDHSVSYRDHLIPRTSTPGLWWWDSSIPINLAEIEECNELHRRDLIGDVAYTGPPLVCRDNHHAGPGTNSDLVTMLLNLACNSVLGMSETFCCT
ncbi:uncharacterized protein LOC119595137 [Penaeus monodon]|uniref:uncharacterized protein LOC119595137 n=1 Tax=Penaeus monodon TaxID=6687 RepID=UPI0018A6DDD9|nr:uncharacterized protein LOC119595137 [Penaeus monodon]